MLMRPTQTVAAATLALGALVLAPATAQARTNPEPEPSVTAVADDGLPGKGLPPSPGPTNPSGPAR